MIWACVLLLLGCSGWRWHAAALQASEEDLKHGPDVLTTHQLADSLAASNRHEHRQKARHLAQHCCDLKQHLGLSDKSVRKNWTPEMVAQCLGEIEEEVAKRKKVGQGVPTLNLGDHEKLMNL